MAEEKGMNPISGDKVETDGVYATEWGREEFLKRGDYYPSDVMMGDTEWKMVALPSEGQKEKAEQERGPTKKPRFHPQRRDR